MYTTPELVEKFARSVRPARRNCASVTKIAVTAAAVSNHPEIASAVVVARRVTVIAGTPASSATAQWSRTEPRCRFGGSPESESGARPVVKHRVQVHRGHAWNRHPAGSPHRQTRRVVMRIREQSYIPFIAAAVLTFVVGLAIGSWQGN